MRKFLFVFILITPIYSYAVQDNTDLNKKEINAFSDGLADFWGMGCEAGELYWDLMDKGGSSRPSMASAIDNVSNKIRHQLDGLSKNGVDSKTIGFIEAASSKYSSNALYIKSNNRNLSCSVAKENVREKVRRSLSGDKNARDELAGDDYSLTP
ncbi:hypothetical protein FOT80_16205 [Serratia fonticola]|nr:hypothetical protein [Serratia fonticola]